MTNHTGPVCPAVVRTEDGFNVIYNDDSDIQYYPLTSEHLRAVDAIFKALGIVPDHVVSVYYHATIHGKTFWIGRRKNPRHGPPRYCLKTLKDLITIPGFRYVESTREFNEQFSIEHEIPQGSLR